MSSTCKLLLFYACYCVCDVFFTSCALANLFMYRGYVFHLFKWIFIVFAMLPTLLLASAINPMFSHAGVTILFYLDNGNPITLESIVYGVAVGGMLITVIIWFSCYNAVMTSDKFIYLFGRIIPALSLILSMVLRFVPRFKAQIKKISSAQKCIGRDVSSGNILMRVRNGLTILSILITWALENAIETADSMKSRGYGLKGRTAFSIYQFDSRDKRLLLVFIICTVFICLGIYQRVTVITFFPSIMIQPYSYFHLIVYSAYTIFLCTPMILNITEDMKWKSIQSNT